MHRRPFISSLHIVTFDDNVVEKSAFGTENFRNGASKQAVVVFFQPLEIEAARQLDRQFPDIIVPFQIDGTKRLKPRFEALPRHVVPNDFETLLPDCFGTLIHI
jgi:hypothetical protein